MNLLDLRLAIFDKVYGKNDKKEKSLIKDLIKQPDNFIFSGEVKNGELIVRIKKGDTSE